MTPIRGMVVTQGMPAGILERNAERQAAAAHRKADAGMDNHSSRAVANFLEDHRSLTARIGTLLEEARSATGQEQDARLAEAAASLAHAEKEASDASRFLPAYDLRQVSASLKQLREQLSSLKGQAQPGKGFSFSRKAASQAAAPPLPEALQQTPLPDSVAGMRTESLPASNAPCPQDPSRGISSARDATLVRGAAELAGGDFSLSGLRGCAVHLRGAMGALRVRGLRGCLVYAGPVAGATFVDDVEGSCLVLVSHQVRIHTTANTTFCLRVQSNPIVERCRDVRFAGLAGGDPDTGALAALDGVWEDNAKWRNVQDFDWLKTTQSPHWSILDEQSSVRTLAESRDRLQRRMAAAESHCDV